MKLSSAHIIFIFALLMFVLASVPHYVIEMPKDIHKMSPHERSITRSGLSPKGDSFLSKSIIIIATCIGLLFFYSYKLDKSLTCENDVLRLCLYWKIYNYMILVAVFLAIARISLALSGLFKIEHISFSHILHSRLFEGIMNLFIFTSFYLFTHKYIKTIKRVPPSVILAMKNKN